jgi:hypothetical protein
MQSHRMNLSLSQAFFIFWLGLYPADASEIPFYSVEQWCDTVAKSVGPRSEVIYGGCVDQEQSAYDTLKRVWNTLSAQTQNWCDRVARSTGGGSYTILNGCVEQEINASQENSTRQFRR